LDLHFLPSSNPPAPSRFVAPVQGRLSAVIANDDVSCRPGSAVLISPKLGELVRAERDTTGLSIFLNGSELRRHLAGLLGESVKAPLEFAASLSLSEGLGRSLARFQRLATAELERPDSILLEPMTARSFCEFVTTALLLHQRHNYAEALRHRDGSIGEGAPRLAFKRAGERDKLSSKQQT
jgi:hypothetical protein